MESPSRMSDEICIGSTLCSKKANPRGTVGPFVRIKETGDLCFLTARHIFGPFMKEGHFVGHEVFWKNKQKLSTICGKVEASIYSERLNVALVKVSKEPSRVRFFPVSEEHVEDTGLHPAQISHYGNVYDSIDITALTPTQVDSHRLIKISETSGLTLGRVYLQDGKITTGNYTILREGPTYMNIMEYKDQLRVVPVEGEGQFAQEEDVGSAVYFVDDRNMLHCIGMICRIMNGNQGVLVTPIGAIINHFEESTNLTIEMVTFNYNSQCTYEKMLFKRALMEGMEPDRYLRINIIGFYAQGKTSLTRRLLDENLEDIESTDGIDVHIRKCKMNENTWEKLGMHQEFTHLSDRLVDVANDHRTTASGRETEDTYAFDSKHYSIPGTITSENIAASNKLSDGNAAGSKTDVDDNCTDEIFPLHIESQQLFRHFTERLNEKSNTLDNELIATIWDFGGQFVYYATHQIFHSRDAIYLLVFDLRKGLNNVLEDYDFPNRQEKMKTSLMFWVNSINAFVGTDDGSKPKIILVGTHRDLFNGDIEKKFNEVKNLFAGTHVRNHIYDQTFAVSNTDEADNEIDKLRRTIYRIGAQNSLSNPIPAKWIPLEMSLLEIRNENMITFEELKSKDAKNDYAIKDEDKLKLFLKYHHEKGTLVFFDEEELRNHVVLNPQFIVDGFRSIITSKVICDGSERLHNLWKKMTGMAILEKEIIDAVWSQNKNTEFFKFRQILLNFLKRHRILAELLKREKSGKMVKIGTYMIPSFLKSRCSTDTAESFLHGRRCSDTILGFGLENKIVLPIVYERVTAAALGEWPPIKFEDQILVFENVGYYRIGNQHAGKITKMDGKGIELMVIELCEPGENISVVSDRFRKYCETVITQEFTKLQNEKRTIYRHYIKCNHSDHNGKGSRELSYLDEIENEEHIPCPDFIAKHSIDMKHTWSEWFQQEGIVHRHKDEIPDRMLTEKDLKTIAQELGNNWELLGVELGLTSDNIQRITQNHRSSGIETVIFYMLKEWKHRFPTKAKQNILMKAMRKTHALSVNWEKVRTVFNNN